MPQEWNSGAAITVRPRARIGIASSTASAGAIELGWLRCAPFGVPVVPLVRITVRPGAGGGSSDSLRVAADQVLAASAMPSVAASPSA